MRLSPVTKAVVTVALVVGAVGYVLLLEFAINAGRVHRGVSVAGFDIGGLNPPEAEAALTERGRELKQTPMIFITEGFDCRFTPKGVGWGPQPHETSLAALEVGREGSVLETIGDRWTAWTEGVTTDWVDTPDPDKVERELDLCQEQATGLGLVIDRDRLRERIEETIVTWPRQPVTIPLEA